MGGARRVRMGNWKGERLIEVEREEIGGKEHV